MEKDMKILFILAIVAVAAVILLSNHNNITGAATVQKECKIVCTNDKACMESHSASCAQKVWYDQRQSKYCKGGTTLYLKTKSKCDAYNFGSVFWGNEHRKSWYV